MYSIPKLCIRNNLPNTTKCNIFLYSNLGFEYKIKKMKSGYTTFLKKNSPKNQGINNV